MELNTQSHLLLHTSSHTLDELDNLEPTVDTNFLDLDTKWITDIEAHNKDYAKFYKDDVYRTQAVFVYIDHDNAITHVSEQDVDLETKNILTQQELASIVNDKNRVGKKKYRLVKCYLYNIDIDPEDLRAFIREAGTGTMTNRFFRQLDLAHDAIIYPTISQFQNLNTIYLFMREKNADMPTGDGTRAENNTRKIKRVSFHPDIKHTRRRGYSSVSSSIVTKRTAP